MDGLENYVPLTETEELESRQWNVGERILSIPRVSQIKRAWSDQEDLEVWLCSKNVTNLTFVAYRDALLSFVLNIKGKLCRSFLLSNALLHPLNPISGILKTAHYWAGPWVGSQFWELEKGASDLLPKKHFLVFLLWKVKAMDWPPAAV